MRNSRRFLNPKFKLANVLSAGDYFVVRITEDPVYGTPVFTTMGGQSKCPGETATSRREGEPIE